MKTYQIEITRSVRQTACVEIEAEDEESAIDQADDAAWDVNEDDWDTVLGSSDFDIGKATIIEEEDEEEGEEEEDEEEEETV